MPKRLPDWAKNGEAANPNLPDLLSLASANFGRHVDWFLRQRDVGIRNLSVVIGAESVAIGLYFTNQPRIPKDAVIVFLALASLLAVLLAWTAIRSCERAFGAALESACLTAKTVWAMGLVTRVGLAGEPTDERPCPASHDKSLYTPRWVCDALRYDTTEAYVRANLRNRSNTHYLAKVTLSVFCACALAITGAASWVIHQS